MDGVKVAFWQQKDDREGCATLRKIRRSGGGALVHIQMIEFNVAIFAWPCVLSDRLPALCWIITRRGVGCVT